MKNQAELENTLKKLVMSSGLRPWLEESGLVRTLEQIAKGEGGRSEPYRLLLEVERSILDKIETECGLEWKRELSKLWSRYKIMVQLGVTEVQLCPNGEISFQSNMLSVSLQHLCKVMNPPDVDLFLKRPFYAWVVLLSYRINIKRSVVKERICGQELVLVDERTYGRWLAGSNIRKLAEGHRKFVLVASGLSPDESNKKEVDYLSGWFLLAIGLQSMSKDQRLKLKQWSPYTGVASPAPKQVDSRRACDFVDEITLPYYEGKLCGEPLKQKLDEWYQDSSHPLISNQYDRLLARLEAEKGENENAIEIYKKAVNSSSTAKWRSEEHRRSLLEALVYCHKAKRKTGFKYFWDKARKSCLFDIGRDDSPSEQFMAYIGELAEGYPASISLVTVWADQQP